MARPRAYCRAERHTITCWAGSPQHHVFAATDLERYASCPFRFFLERVLEIEPVEDLTLEFDVRNRGRVVHDVLAAFHRRVNERLGRPASPLELDAAEFDALLAAAVEDSLPPEPENPLAAALREVDRRLVIQWLSQYRQQLEKYAGLWQDFETPMAPELMEVSFGRSGQPPPSTDQWLEFSREEQAVRISGRIDRVDTGVVAGHSVFNVLDYKTGGPIALTPESITAGLTLQPPLYALAVMELLMVDRNLYPLAGRLLVHPRGRLPAPAGAADVSQRRRPDRVGARLGGAPRHAGRHGRDAGPRHSPRPVSRLQRRRALHRPLPLQHHLPHQSGPFSGEDMSADSRPVNPSGWTDQQQRAISTRGASVALSAGAGCGKTFVLTERFLAELEPGGAAAPPHLSQLVAITFTERAAREMRDRIRKACRERLRGCPPEQAGYWLALLRELDSARISTIHAFCGGLLRAHAVEAGIDPRFDVLDGAQAGTLLFELSDEVLRNRLADRDEAALKLVTRFGLNRLRDMIARLLAVAGGDRLAAVEPG